ncbi:hypothetical protein GCM10010266_05220 [Streptomyces griseomycini]|uniref:SpoIIE family protein phosphatase n=1 Tax=Streptomyces griseomycini TaxID=66895 RepID=UPI001874A3D6|nr:SpoIIE family protein phosphatase [Streptomyces griseomycini]GGP85849.1 hypothetical protein GCM10010266_05220 [Streptomyces griseomycini]
MERLSSPPGERRDETRDTGEPVRTATATIDERGFVTGWSEEARRLLGYAPAQVVGLPAARLLADDADDADEPARRAAGGQERLSGTVALRHHDGHPLRLGLLAHHRRRSDGTGEWLVVCAAADPAARASRDRGEALTEWAFSQVPCVLAVFGTDGRLERANAAMEDVLSVPESRMVGLRLPEIAPGPANEETEERMRLVADTGEPQRAEPRLRPAGAGAEHGRPVTLAPLKDPEGRVRAVCLVAHHEVRERLTQERTLPPGAAGSRTGTAGDTPRTAQELADAAVPRLADFAAVDLLEGVHRVEDPPLPPSEPVTARRVAVRSVREDGPGPSSARTETVTYPALSPPVRCLTRGRGALYGTADADLVQWARQDPAAAWIGREGAHAVLVVPMRAHGTVIGMAFFGRHRRPEPFGPDDLLLAEKLTAQAAVGIHETRRQSRARTTTMTLQSSLLPQTLPDQAALEVASRYLPAATSAGMGGDWFDVIPLSGARVALVVGDVVGHGIRASATMGRLRTAVRTLADVDLPPDELLTHLDDLVLHLSAEEGGGKSAPETAGGIGTTCLYAVYDPVSRHCTLARAGHPPPAVATPDGTVYFLDVPAGPPLGLGGLPFETFETELPEGSLLALYTDGLLQPRDHDIDEGLDKLFTALARPATHVETVCDRVLAAALTHPPDDDVALLVASTRALHADRVAVWDLGDDPVIVAEARRRATGQLSDWGLDDAALITELIVSELVTNAIRYGLPPIQLRLIHGDNVLISEVFDSSNTAPHLRRARLFDEGGRGLLLVAQLAQRWGTRHGPVGKTIWAEQFLAVGV